jgi:uncharacterized repeat protein (TIGR03803 family)
MRTEEDAFADDLKQETAHERAVPSAGCGRLAKALVAAAVLGLLAPRCEATSSSPPSSPPTAEMAVLTAVPQTVHPAARFETTSHRSAAQEAAASYDILHSFAYSDGYGPFAGLIQATDGNFYGTTSGGGAIGYGTAFKMDASGNLATLHSFAFSDGANPYAGLIQATDGNFYGTIAYGGTSGNGSGYGTAFKMDASGNLTTLHSFAYSDGTNPFAGLIQATDGNFYGTALYGGASDYGTAFKMDASGNLTTLHSFAYSDGAYPRGGLIQATDGNFYGTTAIGGASDNGTAFKMDASGNLTTLHSFAYSDGAVPNAGLIQATDGNFYGTTVGGGASGYGTAFKMDASGNLTTLHAFAYSDGAYPRGDLIQATDGNFYGTTYQGGVSGDGTAFKMDASGNVTTLHSFAGSDGEFPWGGLIQATDGNLYGTTTQGGAGQNGVVFRLSSVVAGAKVSGKGSIPIPGGDATFDFVANTTPTGAVPQGYLTYKDHATGMTVKSTVVTSVQVTGTHSRIVGKATIEQSGPYGFIVDVDDLGEPGTGVDKFGIQLSNGYVRSGTLSSGNIQIHK